jgi:hypothetical protein
MDVGTQIRFTTTPKYKDFRKGSMGRIMSTVAEHPYCTADLYIVMTNDKIVWCTNKEFEVWEQLSLLN